MRSLGTNIPMYAMGEFNDSHRIQMYVSLRMNARSYFDMELQEP